LRQFVAAPRRGVRLSRPLQAFAQSVEQVVEAARQWLKTYEVDVPMDG